MRFSFLTDPSSVEIEQVLSLYKLEGWWISSGDDAELVRRIVAGSHCFLAAKEGQTIVGMGRAISDGVSDAYIQDVAVSKPFRGRGTGTEIIQRLLERLDEDGVNWVGLIAERGSHPFYERIGFAVMPEATPMVKIGKT